MKVLYDTGMRVSEISNLKIKKVNFKSKIGNIDNAKGGKFRKFKLSTQLNEELENFITESKKNNKDIIYIFRNYKNKKLSIRSYQEIVKKACQ